MSIPPNIISKVQADWNIVGADFENLGCLLLLKMFTARPNTQYYFASLKGKSIDEVKNDPAARTQGARIISLIDTLVKNASNDAKLKSEVVTFVKNHKARHVGADLIAGTKQELIDAIVESGGVNADAWGIFLDAFIALVKSS